MCAIRSVLVAVLFFTVSGIWADKVEVIVTKLSEPFAVDFDPKGNLIIAEMTKGEKVLLLNSKKELSRFAGTGKKGLSGDDGDPSQAEFNGIHHLAITPDGDIYLADTFNNVIRKIDAKTGKITRFAGTGEKGFAGDGGPALKAKFSGTFCLAFDAKFEKMYVADLGNRRIRMIEMRTGTISTVAGNGTAGVPENDSLAAKSPLVDPRAVAIDAANQIYILERGGHALRVVNAEGKIRTLVGTGKPGLKGDGGDALEATLNGPKHLCIDLDQGVIIADAENNVIRKYDPKTGKIFRIAGTGKKGISGTDTGDPLKMELARPHGVIVHPKTGDLYITDSYNDRILKLVRQK
jgi:DNA-binding beta-propeller fold protein YncE